MLLAAILVNSCRQYDCVHESEGIEILINEDQEASEYRKKMFNYPKSRDNVKYLLEFCYRNGFFDIWKQM